MIKILKYGAKNGITYRTECEDCGTVFTFNKVDTQINPCTAEIVINCPLCGEEIAKEKISDFDRITN